MLALLLDRGIEHCMAAARDGHAAHGTSLSVARFVLHWVNLQDGISKLHQRLCLMRTQAGAAVIGDPLELLLPSPKGPLKMPPAALISWLCVSLLPPGYVALSAMVHKLVNMPT